MVKITNNDQVDLPIANDCSKKDILKAIVKQQADLAEQGIAA